MSNEEKMANPFDEAEEIAKKIYGIIFYNRSIRKYGRK